ncbi:MAG: hypothetical protein ABIE23_01440 [archaeon]
MNSKLIILIFLAGMILFSGCTQPPEEKKGTIAKIEDYTYFFNEDDTSIDPDFQCPGSSCGRNGTGLYARYEWPEKDGECEFNEDCVASGCGGEICASKEFLGGSVCDSVGPTAECACLEGKCRWAVKK